jgi:Tail tubular protein
MSLTVTSKLEAINTMLTSIGEIPVSSITNATTNDVSIAIQILDHVSREVQARGWFFNTDINYSLTPNNNNQIELPANALRVELADGYRRHDFVERNRKLYDRVNNTFTITDNVKVNIVFLLDFSELPEVARHYILIRASRIFQDRMLVSTELHKFHEMDELQSYMNLKEAEGDIGRHNILTGNYDVYRVLDRGNYQPNKSSIIND